MKRGKRPSMKQKKAIVAMSMKVEDWFVIKVDHKYGRLHLVHRLAGRVKEIPM